MKKIYLILISLITFNQLMAQTTKADLTEKLNLVYTSINGWDGKLDFYHPKGNNKIPLVIYIHGGGWTHGNKEAEYEKFKVFIANGFAVANVEYRLANQAPAPAAIEDVNSAINYLFKQAKVLNFDTYSVVLVWADLL